MLRAAAGRNPHDRALSDLVGELSTRSKTFRIWWAAHNVRFHHRSCVKRFNHPVVGDLTLAFEALDMRSPAPQASRYRSLFSGGRRPTTRPRP
jgi:hypothetical protein